MGNFGTVTLTTKAEFEPWFKDVLKKAKPCDSDYSAIEEHIGSLCKTLKPFMLTSSTPRQELDSKFQAIQQAFNLEKEADGRLFEVASKLEALVKFVGQIKSVDQTKVPTCEQDKAPSALLLNPPPASGGASQEGSPRRAKSPSKKRTLVNPKHPQETSPVGKLPLAQATANTSADSKKNPDTVKSPRPAPDGSAPHNMNRADAVRTKARRSLPPTPPAQIPPLPRSKHK